MDQIIVELNGRQVWGIAVLLIFLIVPIGISLLPNHGDPETPPVLTRLKQQMGLGALNGGVFFIGVVTWCVIFGSLFLGLAVVIWQVIFAAHPDPAVSEEVWDWRFALVKFTALTATLGAVVALPFTLVRLGFTRRQTETAVEALLNDKIDAAVADLHAQRQVTEWSENVASNGWQDDVTRRNGAIDRLQGLAEEDPKSAPRIARMLSVYVRELSREFEPEAAPETDDIETLRKWARGLRPKRSDMQNAAQVLGRLKAVSGQALDQGEIDLTGANLQGFALSGLDFSNGRFFGARLQGANLGGARLQKANLWQARLQGADLSFAQLQGADLSLAQLQGAHLWQARLQGAVLHGAQLQGADLSGAQLQGANLNGAQFDNATSFISAAFQGAAVSRVDFTDSTIEAYQLHEMFGDASVILPGGHGPDHADWPEHWSKETLDVEDFFTEWRAFQASIGQDPDTPG